MAEDNGEKRSANDHQVGGSHYRTNADGSVIGPGQEQHWDRLIRLFGLDVAFVWFVGNITKYVERYRRKGGVEDLKKARQYLDKLIEEEEKAEAQGKTEREKTRRGGALKTDKAKEESK